MSANEASYLRMKLRIAGWILEDQDYEPSAMHMEYWDDLHDKLWKLAREDKPDMLALLRELIDIEGPQPGTHAWAEKTREVVAKATKGTP